MSDDKKKKAEKMEDPKPKKKPADDKKANLINAIKGLPIISKRVLAGKVYPSVDRDQVLEQIEENI